MNPRGPQMAILQMGSLNEAVNALVALHQYPMDATHRLRVSFARSTFRQPVDASANGSTIEPMM